MPTLYCSADGAGPRDRPDWTALYRACATDEEVDAVDARRAAEPGHVARNGNAPRTSTLASAQVAAALPIVGVDRGSGVDSFGGAPAYLGGEGVIGRQLLCPECLSPVFVAP